MTHSEKIRKLISPLSKKQIILFGLISLGRSVPLYTIFAKEIEDEQGMYFSVFKKGHSYLMKYIDDLFNVLQTNDLLNNINANEISEELLKYAPDSEAVSSVNSIIAQNCAIAASYLALYIDNDQTQNILYCINKNIESIDILGFGKGLDEPEAESLISKEKEIQITSISLIKEVDFPLSNHNKQIVDSFIKKNILE